jgi:serine/threonine protein kinase
VDGVGRRRDPRLRHRPALGRWATDLGAGTHGFLAPELLVGAHPSVRSDLYSLGRTLLAVLPEELPPRLDALLTRVTSHAPDDRPADAATLRASLASLRTCLGTTAAPVQRLAVATSGVLRTVEPEGTFVIGRGPAADLDVPDPAVSRHHAVVRCHDGVWTIADLASANGLWHGGRRVTRLEVGEQPVTVRLGGPDGVAVVLRPR